MDTSEAGPSDLGSPTPTLMPDEAPISRDLGEIRALMFHVYKEVWDEFNKWKVENSEQQLLLLQKPLPPPGAAEDALLEAFDLRDGEPGEVEIIYLCESEDDIPLHPGEAATVLMCETVHLALPPDFAPHPRYESCTPAVQSIAPRPGSAEEDEHDVLPFVPYADDPTFDVKAYLRLFNEFAWEELGGPDVEVIQFETLRRLYFGHGLSPDEIDATGILPPLRETNREGLIYKMTQRDDLFWPGMMADFPIDVDGVEQRSIDLGACEPDIDNLRGRLDSIFRYFCPNPGCIQAFCPRHVLEFPPIPPVAPRVNNNKYPKGESCGDMCFRNIDDTFIEDSIKWVESDIDELRCILEIIPDTLPCGLAKLVRKPCREVYIQRRRIIPDERVYAKSAKAMLSGKTIYKDDVRNKSRGNFERYLPPGPCSHIGPCDKTNRDCICAEKSVHCSRTCKCGLTCKRRCGCRCTRVGKQTCATIACDCRARGWECDPSVCQCDNITFLKSKKKRRVKTPRELAPDGSHYCQNSDIQRGLAAEVEIKRGAYGLGAFAVNGIAAGQFIGEYVGELISNDGEKKEILRIHLDLNYNFGYNRKFTLDSARVGNETRYINHGSNRGPGSKADGQANAIAETRLVFGEQRIGLFATQHIKKDEEILFDYGKDYWRHKKKASGGSA